MTVQRFFLGDLAIDNALVQGLLVKAGVVFEVDAVLSWDDPEEENSQRYRLVLQGHYLTILDETECQLTEAEYFRLNSILGMKGTKFPFYVFADEEALVLHSVVDGRIPDETVVEVWTADDNFPWTIRLKFPTTEEVLRYDIQAWLYDEDAEMQGMWFLLWLRPLYVTAHDASALLILEVKPSKWPDLEQPTINFQSERKAQCILDVEEHTIEIVMHFSFLIDLEQ
jgi:hypothetical protein